MTGVPFGDRRQMKVWGKVGKRHSKLPRYLKYFLRLVGGYDILTGLEDVYLPSVSDVSLFAFKFLVDYGVNDLAKVSSLITA